MMTDRKNDPTKNVKGSNTPNKSIRPNPNPSPPKENNPKK